METRRYAKGGGKEGGGRWREEESQDPFGSSPYGHSFALTRAHVV